MPDFTGEIQVMSLIWLGLILKRFRGGLDPAPKPRQRGGKSGTRGSGMERTEAVVVGAGVVGLAVARALARAGREVIVLERERLILSLIHI